MKCYHHINVVCISILSTSHYYTIKIQVTIETTYLFIYTRIVTCYVGHSSRGLWCLVWSDLINLNYVIGIGSSFFVIIQLNRLEKTKKWFGLQVWFGMTGFTQLKYLYLGQEYIWFGFWEL